MCGVIGCNCQLTIIPIVNDNRFEGNTCVASVGVDGENGANSKIGRMKIDGESSLKTRDSNDEAWRSRCRSDLDEDLWIGDNSDYGRGREK